MQHNPSEGNFPSIVPSCLTNLVQTSGSLFAFFQPFLICDCDRCCRAECVAYFGAKAQFKHTQSPRHSYDCIFIKSKQWTQRFERGGLFDAAEISEGLRRHLSEVFAREKMSCTNICCLEICEMMIISGCLQNTTCLAEWHIQGSIRIVVF